MRDADQPIHEQPLDGEPWISAASFADCRGDCALLELTSAPHGLKGKPFGHATHSTGLEPVGELQAPSSLIAHLVMFGRGWLRWVPAVPDGTRTTS